jgi:plastocyanin
MKSPLVLVSSIAAAAALTLAACGSDGGSGSPQTVPADTDLEVLAGPGIRWDKADYTATAGDVKVALVNRDTQTHTLDLVAEDGTKLPGELRVNKSGDVDTGDFNLTAGTYQIVCLVPGHDAMKATLTVS